MDDELRELLVEHLDVPAGAIGPDVPFEELGLDSLALIEFTMVIKKQLGVVLGDELLQGSTTLAEAVALVEAKAVRV